LLSYRRAWERKNREGEAHRSLAGGGGTAAANVQKKFRSPSNVAEERGGGVDDKDVGRRRASVSVSVWSRLTAEQVLCSVVRR
jgi:hypothetical protein